MAAPTSTPTRRVPDQHGRETVTITSTAGYDYDIDGAPNLVGLTVQVQGGTPAASSAVQASNDETNFAALPTAVDISSAGLKSVALADLGFRKYRIHQNITSGTVVTTVVLTRSV